MALTEWYVNDAGSGTGSGTSEANAMSYATFTDFMVTGGTKTAAPGDRFNIKGAITGRTTTADTWVNGGNATSPVIIRGYNSTIGDLTSLARTNGNGPLVTTNYPTISYTTGTITVTGSFIIIEALQISGANTSATVGVLNFSTGTDNVLKRCYVFNSSTSANAIAVRAAGARCIITDNDISLTGASGGLTALDLQSDIRVIGNRVKGGPAIGIRSANNGRGVVALNTVYVSTGIGISSSATANVTAFLYNTIVGGGADGINIVTGTTTLQCMIGNMITDNTGGGIDMTATTIAGFTANNRFRDNAAAYQNNGDWITATSYNEVTTDTGGAETDYVNSGSNDYRLIAASPAKGAGNPLYLDIGALQRQEQEVSYGFS